MVFAVLYDVTPPGPVTVARYHSMGGELCFSATEEGRELPRIAGHGPTALDALAAYYELRSWLRSGLSTSMATCVGVLGAYPEGYP